MKSRPTNAPAPATPDRVAPYRSDPSAVQDVRSDRPANPSRARCARRDFLVAAGTAGAGLALRPLEAAAQFGADSDRGALPWPPRPSSPTPQSPSQTKRFLILGGTGFIGPHTVRYAVERGHEVTIFTRGRADADLPDVERLVGDRDGDLTALEGRRWDAVFDNNCQNYRWARLSTELLRDAAEHYIFVSSISAYAIQGMGYANAGRVLWEPAVPEDYARHEPPEGWQDGDDAPYGLMKRLSEDIAHAAFPDRTTVIRPGLIVGPTDPTDRFTYWPVRIAEGGEILAPGNPDHSNQIIDQRDLTEWTVRVAEEGIMGDFNATGPASRLSMAETLYGIRAVTSRPMKFTWIPEDFLAAHDTLPWRDLPAWIPGDALQYVDVSRAVAAGLTFRPLAVTARDTLDWDRTRPAAERERRRAGMSREKERGVLGEWAAR